jgi:glycosyltransferase involved in cell wall biosynthesis
MVDKHNTICCIFNLAPHYRATIYKLIDQEFKADFYFGDRTKYPIKLMDYENELKGYKGTLKYIPLFGKIYYLSGSLKLALKEYSYYLVTGEVVCVSTWLLLIINRLLRKKTYLWTHGFYGDENFIESELKKLFFKMSTGVLLYGNRARQIMLDHGFSSAKLNLIYNSLDYSSQKSIRESFNDDAIFKEIFKNNLPTVIYIGRVQKKKRLDLLIKAISKLNSEGTKLNLFIVGDHVFTENLEKLPDSLNIADYVRFYGPCYDEVEAGRFLFNASVCVSPGNVGLSVVHSLSFGTPVITHDNFSKQMPEYEAIISGITGDFFRDGSLEDLSAKILRWTNLSFQERLIVRRESYRIIEEFYNPVRQIQLLKTVLLVN